LLRKRQRYVTTWKRNIQTSNCVSKGTFVSFLNAIPDQPHVPLSDTYYAYEDMYALRSSYFDPASDAVRRDKEGIMRAGGYRVEEAYERALRYAVAGLDISLPRGDVSLSFPQQTNTSSVDEDVVMASV